MAGMGHAGEETRKGMDMDKLKVGVIGLGIGRSHIEQFLEHSQTEIAAIADLDETRLESVGEQHAIAARYNDAAQMLKNESLDVVTVATPNSTHKPLTVAALEAGCHVLCEKPMAMNAIEAREMLNASRTSNRRLMIDFSYRFMPQSWQLKKEVDGGLLGDIYFADTRWLRRCGLPRFGGWFGRKEISGGGPLIDLGVHRLDLALWLMNYPKPVWVMASTYDHLGVQLASKAGTDFDVEDFAAAMISFDNGATLHLTTSWASHIQERELMETRLLGTGGGLVQRNMNEGYEFESEIYLDGDDRHYDMRSHGNLPGPGSAIEHFIDCILNDRPHSATGEEGLIVMELLDAIYESAGKREPVTVDA